MKMKYLTVGLAVSVGAFLFAGCAARSPQVALGSDVTVFGTPVNSGGTVAGCPGTYAGYVNYTKTVAQGWGWPPTAGVTNHVAADGGGRTDTKVVYSGKSGDNGCGTASVRVPNPTASTKYRFTIYFPNNVPTTNYPILLTGFDP